MQLKTYITAEVPRGDLQGQAVVDALRAPFLHVRSCLHTARIASSITLPSMSLPQKMPRMDLCGDGLQLVRRFDVDYCESQFAVIPARCCSQAQSKLYQAWYRVVIGGKLCFATFMVTVHGPSVNH